MIPENKAMLLYKFSLKEYVPETHWTTNRGFELDELLSKKDFEIEENLIKFNQDMPDAKKFVLWNIPQYK